MDWKKTLLAAGGAAGVAAALYYLLKEESTTKKRLATETAVEHKAAAKPKVDEISKEQVHQILQEILKSQEQMKHYMKDLTKELCSKSLSFEQTYQRVKEVQPEDPLEKYGLSMMEFDQLLDKHQSDAHVKDAIARIMGAPTPGSTTSEKVKSISLNNIIEVHKFMLKELDKLVQNFQTMPNKESYDMKTVTIAAQACVGSKVEGTFGITSEDIETAVLVHHTTLATDQEFASINIQIQQTMGKLMGTPFNQA